MNMDNYSKAVEEMKTDRKELKEQMHVIGLKRIKSQKEKQPPTIEKLQTYDQKKQIQIEYDS